MRGWLNRDDFKIEIHRRRHWGYSEYYIELTDPTPFRDYLVNELTNLFSRKTSNKVSSLFRLVYISYYEKLIFRRYGNMKTYYERSVNELLRALREKETREWQLGMKHEAAGHTSLARDYFEKFNETDRLINRIHLAVSECGLLEIES